MVFPTSDPLGSFFIVIVPGYMGSLLRDRNTGEMVWLDIPAMLKNPTRIDDTLEKLKYPNPDLEPAGLMEHGVLFVPPWGKLQHYGRLLEYLGKRGYAIEPAVHDPTKTAVYRFAYDWRQNNILSAQQLGEAVRGWRQKHNGAKAVLIAHSNGGIISRWFIEKEGGAADVVRLFLMGSPWDGSPKSMRVLFEGYNVVGRRLLNFFGFNKKLNEIIRTFPSYYQLIPHNTKFLRDENNQVVNPFTDLAWTFDVAEQKAVADGLKFNQELGNTLSTHTICYFGRKKPTTTTGIVKKSPSGKWESIQWVDTEAGDGTVTERSAVHPQSKAQHAFAVDHGSIYFSDDVLTQLEFDLKGGLGGLEFVTVTLDNMTLEFDADQDFYAPGDPIQVNCKLRDTTPEAKPVTDAKIEVSLRWNEPLPGDEEVGPPAGLPSIQLKPDAADPGLYLGSLSAPAQQGIYTLHADVKTSLVAKLQVEETIAVEAEV
jgi:hypothetical protein